MRKYNLPIFIPHLGCPHDCAFCNQRKITGIDTEITPEYIENRIETFFSTINDIDSMVEIAFFGGSFTAIPMDLQENFLKVAEKFSGKICGIRVSTRPDAINEEILALLKKYNVTEIELGAQSSDDIVLTLNNRGHLFSHTASASKLIKSFDIRLGLQMMVGMYGSSPEKDIKTAEDIIALNPDSTRIYPTLTLKGTALEKFYLSGDYIPYDMETAVEVSATILSKFRENNITVLRIGLHSEEGLNSDTVTAGPYHPAFGELVENRIWRNKIENNIIKDSLKDCELVINSNPSEVSKIIGHKKCNYIYFKEKYGVRLKIGG